MNNICCLVLYSLFQTSLILIYFTEPSQSMETVDAMPTMTVAANQGQEIQPSIPGSGTFVNVLQHQQQQHLEQIEQLQRQLQEQQSINQQQQQQISQQLGSSGEPNIAQPTMSVDNQAMQFQSPQMHQGGPQVSDVLQVPQGGPSHEPGADQPRFQLQPHVLAQIQALTGNDGIEMVLEKIKIKKNKIKSLNYSLVSVIRLYSCKAAMDYKDVLSFYRDEHSPSSAHPKSE